MDFIKITGHIMDSIVIAIDPDIEASGLALVVNGKIMLMNKYKISQLIDEVLSLSNVGGGVIVKMENTEANKPIFWRDIKGTPEQKRKINLTIAQKVGMVKGVTRMIKEMLESKGVPVHMIKPLKGSVKKAKKDAAFFNQITGWEGRSNEDGRDAALIALYGVIK